MKRYIIALIVLAFCIPIQTREKDSVAHVMEGNLALPTSQQPACLFGFGQNLVDQGDFLGYLDSFGSFGCNDKAVFVMPNFLYGITEDLSLLVGLPIATKLKRDGVCSSGVSDLFMQFEYAYHNKDRPTYANQCTLVGNVSFPTGSPTKNPATGTDSATFFIGTTASHLSTQWYVYGSLGTLLPLSRHGIHLGNAFLYDAAIGRNIAYSSNKWLLTALIEFDGFYSQRDRISGVCNPNSGGNVLYLGPSFWFATQRFSLQGGFQFPVSQHLFGQQDREKWIFYISIGCKFTSPQLTSQP